MTALPLKGKEGEKPLFDSGPIRPGGLFEFVFEKEGTYNYSCKMDDAMKGKVVVTRAIP